MNKYGLILYDLDGTIWDSIPLIMKCFKLAYLDVFGRCDRSDEDLKSYIGRPLPDTFAMHDPKTSEALLKAYFTHNGALLENDKIPLFDGVISEMHKIRDLGIPQGFVTSKRTVSAGITLRLKGLDNFFDVGICKEDTENHKPNPDPIITAAKAVNITDMSRVIYIGDALVDALCAKNAGTDFALVEWSQMDKEKIIAAAPSGSRIISRFTDVLDYDA
ncbi:MAG: HAD family hydrolase [Lachnospiraceae bacterium]|nr:HAD family hydrolase [Lachnospiraceae bacterium]